MAKAPAPFSGFEWLIAWRYLRSRRAQGGISVITWLSLAGVMLGVAILIVVQAVMVGFREEITTRIIGANAHITLYSDLYYNDEGAVTRVIPDFDNIAAAIRNVPGVAHVAPMVRGQVMISGNGRNAGVDLRGERLEDLRNLPLVASPEEALGDIDRLSEGDCAGCRRGARVAGVGGRCGCGGLAGGCSDRIRGDNAADQRLRGRLYLQGRSI